MKTRHIFALRTAFLATALLLPGSWALSAAQPVTAPASNKANPLGLPRLKATDASPLTKAKFDEDTLGVAVGSPGARKQTQRGVDYLTIDGGALWSRALRGSSRDIVFVSFCANISAGTEIDIAGAVLKLEPATQAGKAELVVVPGSEGSAGAANRRSFLCGFDTYGGQPLAALPVLTVRLDPAADVWDLYIGTHLFAENLPLVAAKKNVRNMTIRAGSKGAQLSGLVVADDNPLFVDGNANGIADSFEVAHHGSLLSAQSPAADRAAVVKAWRKTQGPGKNAILPGTRPAPDRVAKILPPSK